MRLIWGLRCCMATINQHARLSLYRQQFTVHTQYYMLHTPSTTRASKRRDKTWTHPLECTEGRRTRAALLFIAGAFWFCPAALLTRSVDEAFIYYCNKPDAPLPARQTERTAFHRFYRSCCCYCSPPWWTAHHRTSQDPQRSHEGLTANIPDWNYSSLWV